MTRAGQPVFSRANTVFGAKARYGHATKAECLIKRLFARHRVQDDFPRQEMHQPRRETSSIPYAAGFAAGRDTTRSRSQEPMAQPMR
jgi:hypothetical protein